MMLKVSDKAIPNGVASLDANGLIPSEQLPSYVDSVVICYPIDGATELSAGWLSNTDGGDPITPAVNKIYVLVEDSPHYTANSQFRWDGVSTYVKLYDGGMSPITVSEIDSITDN